jgi:hypothetical protein
LIKRFLGVNLHRSSRSMLARTQRITPQKYCQPFNISVLDSDEQYNIAGWPGRSRMFQSAPASNMSALSTALPTRSAGSRCLLPSSWFAHRGADTPHNAGSREQLGFGCRRARGCARRLVLDDAHKARRRFGFTETGTSGTLQRLRRVAAAPLVFPRQQLLEHRRFRLRSLVSSRDKNCLTEGKPGF